MCVCSEADTVVAAAPATFVGTVSAKVAGR